MTNKRKLTINRSVLYNSEICKNNAPREAVDGKKKSCFSVLNFNRAVKLHCYKYMTNSDCTKSPRYLITHVLYEFQSLTSIFPNEEARNDYRQPFRWKMQ